MAEIISFSVSLCERILQEKDNVLSAIRMVDVFVVPDERPPNFIITFWVMATVKFKVGTPPGEIPFRFTILRKDGGRETLAEEIAKIQRKFDDPSIPMGAGVIIQVQLIPKNLGTLYLEFAVDEKILATVPFTLLPTSAIPQEPK